MKRDSNSKEEKIHTTKSEKETFFLARDLAKDFKGKEVVLLVGELGAGKTIFAKGIAAGLKLRNVHQVCSPSYTLVNIYQAKYTVFHIDLFRLESDSDILSLGWEDYLDQGVVIVEWAEKIKFNLEGIFVYFKIIDNDHREIKICF